MRECPFCGSSANIGTLESEQWMNFHLMNHKLYAECKKLGIKENEDDS